MGKKSKFRLAVLKIFSGNAVAVWMLVLAAIVIATAPSTPSIITPSNGAVVFDDNVTLTCSGSSDAESNPIYYWFYSNFSGLGYNGTNSNVTSPNTNMWYQVISSNGGGVFDDGTSFLDQHIIRIDGDTGTANSVIISSNFTFTDNWFTIHLNATKNGGGLTSYEIRINNTFVLNSSDISVTAGNYTFNVTRFNDGTAYNISLKVNTSTAQDNTKIETLNFWWKDFGKNPLQNTSSTSMNWNNITSFGNSNSLGSTISTLGFASPYYWYCKACDNNSECSSSIATRNLYVLNISSCSDSSSNIALNFTLVNESNNQKINGTISNSNYMSSLDYSNSYSFSQTGGQYLDVCANPSGISFNAQSNATGSATNFVTRNYVFPTYTVSGGSLQQYLIYLLDSSSGAYVTFQVVDTGNSPLSNVYVTAQKTINGNLVTVASGYTDSSGGVTFWLDPLSSHTITASKSGYPTASVSITPTQSSYTITLGGSTSLLNVSYFEGISYSFTPSNIILNNNTIYNFSYAINSSYWNLSSYGFTLTNSSGYIFNSTSGNGASGGVVSVNLSTLNQSSITMNYWWKINGNYTNQSYTWKVKSTYKGRLSIMNLFDDFSRYADNGFGAGFDNFGKILLSIIIIVSVTIWLTYEFGIYSMSGILFIVLMMTFILEKTNLLPPLVRKYLLSSFIAILVIAFLVSEQEKK